MDVRVKFGDSVLNTGRIVRLFVGRTFVRYLIAFCNRPEAANDVVSGMFVRPLFRDQCVKFRDHRLNLSEEMQPKAVRDAAFSAVFRTSVTADWK